MQLWHDSIDKCHSNVAVIDNVKRQSEGTAVDVVAIESYYLHGTDSVLHSERLVDVVLLAELFINLRTGVSSDRHFTVTQCITN